MTCKGCFHYEACKKSREDMIALIRTIIPHFQIDFFEDDKAKKCEHFKDRLKFIELPDIGEYTTVKTLDEAIDHCFSIVNSTDENICTECKAEHLRLCGWLGELKRRTEANRR